MFWIDSEKPILMVPRDILLVIFQESWQDKGRGIRILPLFNSLSNINEKKTLGDLKGKTSCYSC